MIESKKTIAIDGFQINAQTPKPRALSNLKTIGGYGSLKAQLEMGGSSSFKKSAGLFSPDPRKKILDELPWEDRQKILGYSMAKINKLNRDDLLKELSIPGESPYNSSSINIRQF